MLTNPTLATLESIGLPFMAEAYREQLSQPAITDLTFDERLGLIVDREAVGRDNRRLASRLKTAKLRENATVEDINFRAHRGLDKSLVMTLASSQWVDTHLNVIVVGATGVGKTYLACALAHSAIRHGHTAVYVKTSRLLADLALGRVDGRFASLLARLAKVHVLILDDFGLASLTQAGAHDLFDVIDDRSGTRSTIPDPTLADAILDRLVHSAHTISLTGDSLRKAKGPSQ